MKKIIIAILLIFIGGCGILQTITGGGWGGTLDDGTPDTADIRNWDFSACVEDTGSFDTCFSLLWDNRSLILNGAEVIPNIFESL